MMSSVEIIFVLSVVSSSVQVLDIEIRLGLGGFVENTGINTLGL